MAYPFAFEKPWIGVGLIGQDPIQSAVVGNVQNPAYFSRSLDDFKNPMSFGERIENLLMSIILPLLLLLGTAPVQYEVQLFNFSDHPI